MNLVGFITRIYHDARSSERQINHTYHQHFLLLLLLIPSLWMIPPSVFTVICSHSLIFQNTTFSKVNLRGVSTLLPLCLLSCNDH